MALPSARSLLKLLHVVFLFLLLDLSVQEAATSNPALRGKGARLVLVDSKEASLC